MNSKLFLIGVLAGVLAASGVAGVVSTLSKSEAQMMGGGNMGMGMTAGAETVGQARSQWSSRASFDATGTSNVENLQLTGISITGDKQVTVNIRYSGNDTSPSVVLVASSGSAGQAASMGSMGGMHSGMMEMDHMGMMSGMPMMGHGMQSQYPAWNNTQWQEWHNRMAQLHGQLNSSQLQDIQEFQSMMTNLHTMMGSNNMSSQQMPMWNEMGAMPAWQQPLIGSAVLESGWGSNATVTVALIGDGSAYDSNNVRVMVYPLTS